MEFGVLGPLRVVDDGGQLVDIGSPTQRVILAALLVRVGEVVSLDTLVDAVWRDEPPASAVNTLRSQVSRLRRLVGDRITGSSDGYVLVLGDADVVDATRFDRAVRRARVGRDGATLEGLIDAVEAWRGRAFGELADAPPVRAEARRLELARLDATELLARAELDRGRLSEAAARAEAVVAVDDVREPSWAILVRALARAGRVAEALRAARRATVALREAGLDAGPDLRAAETEALDGSAATAAAPDPDAHARPPAPLTPTIGRLAEHRRVVDALGTARLVTIVGPGGVGKTRLAVDVARDVAPERSRGAILVELARVNDEAGVVSTIAAALDLRTVSGQERRALDGAGALEALLVLDNCEHVVDAVVSLVPRMLGSGDRLSVLATSRESLALAGEHVVAIAPLSTTGSDAPAAELFRQRAAAAAPAGHLDDTLIAELTARVDGLPLALEMAAARLRTMSLAELSESIGHDLDVLASSRRDVDQRHRTLRDLLAWSERLLNDDLRAALLHFTVFAGPVAARDLPAAISTARPADTVAQLVDRSLVLAVPSPGGVRFSTLETVRSFGRERMRAAGADRAARHRHAEWFRAAAAEIDVRLRGPDEAAAIVRFWDILDELRAAVRWSLVNDLDMAAAIVDHTYLAGRTVLVGETVSWAIDVVDRLPDDHPAWARAAGALAGGLSTMGRLDDAVAIAERVLARTGHTSDVRYALEGLGESALYQGRFDDAIDLGTTLHQVALSAGDLLYADAGTIGVALGHAYAGRPDDGLAQLAAGPASPAPSSVAWFEYVRGEAILDRDPPAALEHLQRAEAIARRLGHRYLLEVAMVSVSSLKARIGEVDEAVDRFVELLDHFGAGGDPGHLVTTLRNLVVLLVRLDHHRAAAALYGAVVDHPSSPSYGDEAARLAGAEAECRRALGDVELERVVVVGRHRSLDESVAAARSVLLTVRRGAATSIRQ